MLKIYPFLAFFILFFISSTALSSKADQPLFSIEKSPNDQREYDFIILRNKLRVLLVSDPDTDKSSASLDVNIGSATDPIDYPGLAHFLEHMLFLGTEKYPEPDAYQKYIRQHGGSHNAYTSPENTNYFFDIRPEFLEGALDRFSEQFTHPLFNAEYVEREVNAVHSEFTSKIKDDGRRFYSVIKDVFADNHPYSRFSVGNLETLTDKNGVKLRTVLLGFYDKHYSANQMTLVILGKEPLKTLRKWAVSKFSNIKNKDTVVEEFSQDFFDDSSLPIKIESKSIMDKRSMMLAFPIPSSSAYLDSKPVSYLSNLIGHEGVGSLLSALKKENLVDSLSSGGEFNTRVKELFIIRMSLTKHGYENQNRILEIIYSYINLLRKQKLDQLYFDEQKAILNISFNFQEKAEPIHFASRLSRALQYSAPSEVLIEPYLLTNFDDKTYQRYLDLLNPNNMLVTISANDIEGDKTTPWYDTPYSTKKLSNELIESLISSSENPDLKLPEKNIFIPDNISIISNANTSKPELLRKEQGLEVWHLTDTSFGTPKSNLFVTIRSPISVESAATLNMTDIMVDLLTDSLGEFSYPAYLAGLNYELYNHMRGVTIKISGYNDKQTELLSKILSTLKFNTFSNERFAIMKERLYRQLNNAKDRKPFQQAISKAQNILINPSWNEQERLAALKSLELKDINSFRKEFLSALDIAILSSGNISRTSTLNSAKLIESYLLTSADNTEVKRASIKKLSNEHSWLNEFPIDHSDTGFVHYIQGTNASYSERAKFMLLTQILASDYYNQIRTEKQLGYIVFATNFELLEVPGLAFIVQSPSASGERLHEETRSFLSSSIDKVASISNEDLAKHKSSVIANLLKQDNTLYARSNVFWKDIDIKNFDFDTKQRLANAIGKLEIEDLTQLLKRFNQSKNSKLTIFTKQVSEDSSELEAQSNSNLKSLTKEKLDIFENF